MNERKQKFEMEASLSPHQVAEAFWNLDSDGHVEFFAALDRMAGIDLCMQMAWVVNAIAESGNSEAQNGFQTMLAHASHYKDAANDWRAFKARLEIDRMVEDAKRAGGEA